MVTLWQDFYTVKLQWKPVKQTFDFKLPISIRCWSRVWPQYRVVLVHFYTCIKMNTKNEYKKWLVTVNFLSKNEFKCFWNSFLLSTGDCFSSLLPQVCIFPRVVQRWCVNSSGRGVFNESPVDYLMRSQSLRWSRQQSKQCQSGKPGRNFNEGIKQLLIVIK